MIGKILGDRYQIIERIGGGGMAIVYRGLDVLLHRPVSVKTLRPEFVGDAEFVRRFKREAQAAASLSHPNIVNIYDVGQDLDSHYIVMEYVEGKTLKQLIEERAPLPVDEAVGIARQICDALAHAHDHHIVHRDVKPHNILISTTGRVKVTDFGIARAISTNTITHYSSSVLGSVHYFSPEQARGATADVKSDVYSLGIVLYEMLTGQLPFSGETPISVALKHLQENFVEPRNLSPRIPQSIENIVLKALMKDPEQRYPSVRQMADDLERGLLLPDVPKFVSVAAASREQVMEAGAAPLPLKAIESSNPVEEVDGKKPWWKKVLTVLLWVILFGGLTLVAVLLALWLFSSVLRVNTIALPRVVGLSYSEARTTLLNKGFQSSKILESFDTNSTSTVKIGQVESQSPTPGNIPANSDIHLVIKEGSAQITMPSLSGLLQSIAQSQLVDLSVPTGHITVIEQSSASVPINQVISTTPAPGTAMNANTTQVTLVVSAGTQSAAVPDVVNKPLSTATAALKADGFTLGQVTTTSSFSVPQNEVISQTPAPGQQASAGSTVALVVSSGVPSGTSSSTYPVTVSLTPGTPLPVEVKIVVIDATGTSTPVTASQNSPSATYQVHVVTTPTQAAEVDVYENGQLVSSQSVSSNSGNGNGNGNGTTG